MEPVKNAVRKKSVIMKRITSSEKKSQMRNVAVNLMLNMKMKLSFKFTLTK